MIGAVTLRVLRLGRILVCTTAPRHTKSGLYRPAQSGRKAARRQSAAATITQPLIRRQFAIAPTFWFWHNYLNRRPFWPIWIW